MAADEHTTYHYMLPDGSLGDPINWDDPKALAADIFHLMSAEERQTFFWTSVKLLQEDTGMTTKEILKELLARS